MRVLTQLRLWVVVGEKEGGQWRTGREQARDQKGSGPRMSRGQRPWPQFHYDVTGRHAD